MRSFAAALALLVTLHSPQLPVVQLPPQQTFAEWLLAFKADAAAQGISQATLETALGGLEPLPVVVDRDRSQAELVLTLEEYLKRRLTPKMIRSARTMTADHRTVLRRVAAQYHVPAGVIVAIWGLESNFGRFSGVRPTIATLATLAYDPRRASMFRQELIDALRILDSGDVSVENMRGSWAGALGQAQFMPSSFLQYAQDFDGDGRRDIWDSRADALASIAHYFQKSGWREGEPWGRAVRPPAGFSLGGADTDTKRSLRDWGRLGFRAEDGGSLPASELDAAIVLPNRGSGQVFLGHHNLRVIRRYNSPVNYGLAVGLLSDRFG